MQDGLRFRPYKWGPHQERRLPRFRFIGSSGWKFPHEFERSGAPENQSNLDNGRSPIIFWNCRLHSETWIASNYPLLLLLRLYKGVEVKGKYFSKKKQWRWTIKVHETYILPWITKSFFTLWNKIFFYIFLSPFCTSFIFLTRHVTVVLELNECCPQMLEYHLEQ